MGWKKRLAVMHYMIQGIEMNLSFMMLQNIKDVANWSRTCLPYAMVFTLIVRGSQVDLKGENYKEMVHTDYLSTRILHCMKFEKRGDRLMRRESE